MDGVTTDGTLYIGPQGEAFKAFNILDGHGLKMLKLLGHSHGDHLGPHEAVTRRAHELATPTPQGSSDKSAVLDKPLASPACKLAHARSWATTFQTFR